MDSALQNSFFLLKTFFWSIVDLQCCVSFRYTAQWISYTYIHSFFRFFSHIGHCCIVAKPCLTDCDPVDYRFPRLLCPWDSPSKNTGVGCHFLFEGIFPTQGLNLRLLFWQADSLPLSHMKSPCRPLQSQSNCFLHVTSLLVNLGWFSSAYCLQHKLLHVLGFQGLCYLALPHLYMFVFSYLSSIPQPLGSDVSSSSTSFSQGVVLRDPLVLFVGWLVCLAFSS